MGTALITGGSKGLGRAVATALDRDGWNVLVTARNAAELGQAVAGTGIDYIPGDIREGDHRRLLAAAVGEDLDLLINNASHLGPSPLLPVGDVSAVELHAVFDTNVVSPLALTGLVIRALQRRRGVIVNISSDAAIEPYPRWGPYGASKAAMDHASSIIAAEYPGLDVYAFDPGDMRTGMHQAAFPGEDISDRPLPESVVPSLLRLLAARPPSGRYVAGELLGEAA